MTPATGFTEGWVACGILMSGMHILSIPHLKTRDFRLQVGMLITMMAMHILKAITLEAST